MSEKYIIPTPGDVIAGKYYIEEELGRGAYGVVFRARQEGIDRHVALKTLLPKAFLETDIVERFEREANFVGRLNHPNIVGVHDYGRHENLLYMSVEYVEGDTLDEIIERDGPLEPERVRGLVYQMVDALEHAHETGIVHRDLKPANIVILRKPVDESGEEKEVVKVLDFGIAKLIQSESEGESPETLTQAGTVLGTPHYMSPETIIGEVVDHRADLYSLGVMIYEMLTGERPFGAKNSPGVMVKHLRDEPPELPAPLAGSCWGDVVRGCMKKAPEKRLQSANEVRRILERRDEGKYRASAPACSTAKAKALEAPASTKRVLVPAIAIGILAAVGIAIGFQWIPLGDKSSGERDLAVVGAQSESDPHATNAPVSPKPVSQKPVLQPVAEASDAGGVERDSAAPNRVHAEGPAERPSERQAPGDEPGAPIQGVEIADRSNTLGTAANSVADEDATTDRIDAPERRRRARAEREDRKRASNRSKRPAKKASKSKISLRIETVPSNARVTVDGSPVGASPVEYSVVTSDTPLTIELHHIGYRTKYRTVVPDKDQTVHVELEKGRLKLIP